MIFVVCVLAWLAVVLSWWWTHRNRYWDVAIKTNGDIKQQIVQLPLRHILNPKLRQEIKIFNRLCLVMPTIDGVAVMYREQMKALLRNPRYRPRQDPYERLFYGYACYVLSQKYKDEIKCRQLHRNLIFLLAPKRKIIKKINAILPRQQYLVNSLPIYKVFHDTYCDPLQPGIFASEPWQQIVAHGSYIKYVNHQMVVKRYAHAYELKSDNWQMVTIKVATDKRDFTCEVNRGVIICKHLRTGESHTFTVRGEKIRLATSLCEKKDALEIYLSWQGEAVVGLDGGEARWLTDNEISENKRLEGIVDKAYRAKYITGEKLRTRYLAASKLVPSLDNLTKVVILEKPEDFINQWNSLNDFKKVARLFGGFNLVFIYSGAVPIIEETVRLTVKEHQITECHRERLWIYFVDRSTTDPDALYLLIRLSQSGHYVPLEQTPPGLAVSRTWPYTKTLTVSNTLPQKMTKNLVIPLVFHRPSIVSAHGTVLTVVGLASGKISHYVLPTSLQIKNEWLTTHINIPLKVKLAGYETRQFTITRQENNCKSRLTKKELVTALQEIEIKTDDKKFDAIFNKTIVEGDDMATLAAVKVAYQNQDRKLLLAALDERHQITADVWQYLLTQIVGLRARVDKIYLTPCINIMGEFTVKFVCMEQQYAFSTKKNLSSKVNFVTIKHGNSNG